MAKNKQVFFRPLSELNVIDNFLFYELSNNEETNEEFFRILLSTFLQQEFRTIRVIPQKIFSGVDTDRHGIRLDVYIEATSEGEMPDATIYDIEAESRAANKNELPHRNRFYTGIIDVQHLASGASYLKMKKLITLTILSYDPFGLGEMWYEARTMLATHPDYPYDDGIRRIFLYADGRLNKELLKKAGITNGERIRDMLKYICRSTKENVTSEEIGRVDAMVERIKLRKEVSKNYMINIFHDQDIRREAMEEGREEGREAVATSFINFARERSIPDETIERELIDGMKFTAEQAAQLMRA